MFDMGLEGITSRSGDVLHEAIEQTELIFIIGMWSCSSLHSTLLEPVSSFFTGVWSVTSEKGNKAALKSHYPNIIRMKK